MKAKQIRELGKEELLKKVEELKLEHKNLRFMKASQEEKNPLKRRNVRREIARFLTIKKEKGWNLE